MVGSSPSPGPPLSLLLPPDAKTLFLHLPTATPANPRDQLGSFHLRSHYRHIPDSRLWARPNSGPWIHSPFRWSPLPGAVGLCIPGARSPAGVVWSAFVCDRSTTLPFAMVAEGKKKKAGWCCAPLTTLSQVPYSTQGPQPLPGWPPHLRWPQPRINSDARLGPAVPTRSRRRPAPPCTSSEPRALAPAE